MGGFWKGKERPRFRGVRVFIGGLAGLMVLASGLLFWFSKSTPAVEGQDDLRFLLFLCATLAIAMALGVVGLKRLLRRRDLAVEDLLESERRFRTVIESLGEGIIINDQWDVVVYANPRMTELTGYFYEELVGRHASFLLPPEEWEKLQEQTAMRLGGVAGGYEIQLRRKDGTTFWTEVKAAPFRNAQAVIIGSLATITDITESKKAAEALAKSEARLRQVIDAALDAVITIDATGRITGWSTQAERMFGWSRAEAMGRKLSETIVPPELRGAHEKGLARFLSTGEGPIFGRRVEMAALRRSGEVFPAEISVTALARPGEPVTFSGFVRDITERKRAEEALKAQQHYLRTVIDTDPSLIFAKDWDGRFTLVNKAVADVYGATVEDLIGKTDADFNPNAKEVEHFLRDDRQVMTTLRDKFIPEEPVTNAKTRETRWYQTIKVPLIPADGGPPQVLGVASDITDRRRTEEALRENERKLRSLVETTNEWIWSMDRDLRFTYCNPAVERMLGYRPEEILGKSPLDFVHEEDRKNVESAIPGFLAAKRGWIGFVSRWRHKDGTYRHLECDAVPLLDDAGEMRGWWGADRDITERKEAEERLRKSEEQFRTLADNVPGVVYLCKNDSRYTMLYLNDAVEGLTGYPAKDFLEDRLSFVDLYHPDDGPGISPAVDAALAEREPFFLIYRIRHRNGEWRWIEEHGQGVFDERGGLRFLEGTLLDITDRKRSAEERRILEASIQQAQKLESLGVLAGGIAHDFNNMLMGILGHAGLARMKLAPESPVRESLDQIETAALRAADLTRHLLAYSGKGKFVMEVVSLSKLVQETAHLLQAVISKKATLQYHFAPNLPGVEADPTQIRQVVMNLITNASDALGDKSGIIQVSTGTIRADRELLTGAIGSDELEEGWYAYVEVSDNGCGMDEETAGKIFDPFFTTKFTGRGLGLAAVLGIVRGHRGFIKVESQPGRGTTFLVCFPCTELPEAAEAPPAQAPGRWMGEGLVLVVDDEESVRTVARASLEQFGLRVMTASDGKEGVEILREKAEEVSLILLDMTMPRMNGVETFREVRQIRPDVPVILSSGYDETETLAGFSDSKISGFIQKPYQPLALVEKVRDALEGKTIPAAPPRKLAERPREVRIRKPTPLRRPSKP